MTTTYKNMYIDDDISAEELYNLVDRFYRANERDLDHPAFIQFCNKFFDKSYEPDSIQLIKAYSNEFMIAVSYSLIQYYRDRVS